MSASGTAALALLFGFFIFITARGELPQYMQIVGLTKSS